MTTYQEKQRQKADRICVSIEEALALPYDQVLEKRELLYFDVSNPEPRLTSCVLTGE